MEDPSIKKVQFYAENNSWKLMCDINQSRMSIGNWDKFKI
jgi:hypothetical protein